MQQFHTKFEINDLGLISKCLGINVETTESGYLLQQQHNIDALLAKVEMENRTTRSTPMEEQHKLYDQNSSLFNNKRLYQEVMDTVADLQLHPP